jgi:Rhodopirellula transposase.
LKNHWNGTLLSSVSKTLEWAKTMTWKGSNPSVHLLEKVYEEGIKLTKEAMKICERMIKRSENLAKWDITIPAPV